MRRLPLALWSAWIGEALNAAFSEEPHPSVGPALHQHLGPSAGSCPLRLEPTGFLRSCDGYARLGVNGTFN
jgi:hypothetical protein